MDHLLSQLQELDAEIHYRKGPAESEPWFNIVEGEIPVLVSAPHACLHIRDGVEKMEEEYTGAIARYLACQTGCYAIYTTKIAPEDPNWQQYGEYKAAVSRIIKHSGVGFLVDLHGMTNRYNMGVALGTINGKSCTTINPVAPFDDAGFSRTNMAELRAPSARPWMRYTVDHPRFTGGVKSNTVTRFAVDCGIQAVQVELASAVRVVYSPRSDDWPVDYSGEPEAIKKTVRALKVLVQTAHHC